MVETFDDQSQLQFQLLARVEQCRRLARQISDQGTAQSLLDLANEYIEQIKRISEMSEAAPLSHSKPEAHALMTPLSARE
jgi:hypothetical protein